jgi:hypothetical protein
MKKINIKETLLCNKDDFIFNMLGIENFNSPSSRLRFWFEHCKNNVDKIDGDIFEFGVFRGKSLIAMALLLKKLGSTKTIYGFDSFSGFPTYHDKDDFSTFTSYPKLFNAEIIKKHELMIALKGKEVDNLTPKNISDSGQFDDTSEEYINKMIGLYELDNISLISGDFSKTLSVFFSSFKGSIFSCNIDCDLYLGYKEVLPYVYNNLEQGSYVHLDEYYSLKFPGARIACEEFFKEKIFLLLKILLQIMNLKDGFLQFNF